MEKIDDSLRKALKEFAELHVDWEWRPDGYTGCEYTRDVLGRKRKEITEMALQAKLNPKDLGLNDLVVEERRRRLTPENTANSSEPSPFLEELEHNSALDADWKALAIAEEGYLASALRQHGCDPGVIDGIVGPVEQEAAPLRRAIQNERGIDLLAVQLKLLKLLDKLDIRFEQVEGEIHIRHITAPLCYLSCGNLVGAKIQYELERTSKQKPSASLRVCGFGLSGQLNYTSSSGYKFEANPGENWAIGFEIAEKLIPCRLLWGDRRIGFARTFKSYPEAVVLRQVKLDSEEWERVRSELPKVENDQDLDLRQADSLKLAAHTIRWSTEAEMEISASVEAKAAGIAIGPKITLSAERNVKVEFSLPGSHLYHLFVDESASAAWFEWE